MTPYLDIQNLTKRFGARVLFEDISFSIAEGQKVGLIAQNGTGKSTLMSILTGREGYESGSIIWRNDLRIGFLEQSPKFDPEESVLDACFNHQGNEDCTSPTCSNPWDNLAVDNRNAWPWQTLCLTIPTSCCSMSRPTISTWR